MRPQVSIVDYGMGNLFSVMHACQSVGLDAVITSSRNDILNSRAVILPGVGAFGDAMETLWSLDLVTALREVAQSSRLLVGICLGMQVLMTESTEFGRHPGLDIIPGSVLRFQELPDETARHKIPQIGWNRVLRSQVSGSALDTWADSPLAGLPEGEFMYFVHSYYASPRDPGVILSVSRYCGIEFCSSFRSGNVFGCQFHPERSGKQGLQIYRNVAALILE